jgi:lysophospholipase L1-like esterase
VEKLAMKCGLASAFLIASALAVRPADADLRLIAFGDSITEGVGDPSGNGYPRRLQRILKKELGEEVEALKFGLAGETTSAALSRIDTVLQAGGDAVLIMEGTNDVNLISDGVLSIETVIQNLDELARRSQQRDIEPIHATIIPRSSSARIDSRNIITESVGWGIRELAFQRKRRLADVWETFDPRLVEDVFSTYYTQGSDPVGHPNESGYDLIARTFADVLLEIDSVPPMIGSFDPGPLLTEVPANTRFRVPVYEPKGSSGIDVSETKLLINNRVVARAEEGKRKVELTHKGKKKVGCRAEVRVRSQDLANPPNVFDRVIGLYDITGRRVLQGDVDFDCRVDGFDLISLGRRFGIRRAHDLYLDRYDFNLDGRIDGEDLAILAKNFGRSSL